MMLAMATTTSSSSSTESGMDADEDWIGNITTTMASEIINATKDPRYFITPPSDPELAKCINIVFKSDIEILHSWKWWLNGLASAVIGGLGLVGNILAIVVLSGPKMKFAFNQLLITLCVFDSIFLLCNGITSAIALGFKKDWLMPISKVSDAVAHVVMCASVLMMVALTFERHFAICNPHQYRIHLRTTPRWKHLAMYIAPVTVFSIFFNIPLFINLQRRWMANALYVKINLYLRGIHPLTTTGLAPIFILIVLNLRICRGIRVLHQRRTSRNRKELNMAYVAIVIVSLFVVTNMPRIYAGTMEVTNTTTIIHCVAHKVQYIPSMTFYKIDFVARMLMVVNSSVNFIVYCAVSAPFKKAISSLLSPLCCPCCIRCLTFCGCRCSASGSSQRAPGRSGVSEADSYSEEMRTYAGMTATSAVLTIQSQVRLSTSELNESPECWSQQRLVRNPSINHSNSAATAAASCCRGSSASVSSDGDRRCCANSSENEAPQDSGKDKDSAADVVVNSGTSVTATVSFAEAGGQNNNQEDRRPRASFKESATGRKIRSIKRSSNCCCKPDAKKPSKKRTQKLSWNKDDTAL